MNTGNCLKCQKWSPYKCRQQFLCPFDEMVQPVPTKVFLPTKLDSHHVHGMLWLCLPTSPYPILLLVQNLSSKRIALTDKMQPKLHEEYIPHTVVQGKRQLQTRLVRLTISGSYRSTLVSSPSTSWVASCLTKGTMCGNIRGLASLFCSLPMFGVALPLKHSEVQNCVLKEAPKELYSMSTVWN